MLDDLGLALDSELDVLQDQLELLVEVSHRQASVPLRILRYG